MVVALVVLGMLGLVALAPPAAAFSINNQVEWRIPSSGPPGGNNSPPGGGGGPPSPNFSCTVQSGSFFTAQITCLTDTSPYLYQFNWTVNGQFASGGPTLNYSVSYAGIGQVNYTIRLVAYQVGLHVLAGDRSLVVTVDFSTNLFIYIPVLVVSAAGIAAFALHRFRRHSR